MEGSAVGDRVHQLLADSGVSYRTTTKSFVLNCPLCRKKDLVYVYRQSGRFVCFYCAETEGFQGAPEFLLKELTSLSLTELRLRLYGADEPQAAVGLNVDLDDLLEEDDEVVVPEPLPDVSWPYYFLSLDRPAAAPGVEYLASRGISLDLATQYGLRYSPQDRSVVFPVIVGGHLVGWQTRIIDEIEFLDSTGRPRKRIKALSGGALAGNRSRCVMFADRIQGQKHAVICEGPISAIKAHLIGGNVATMGKEISPGQIALILRSGVERVYLAIDPDAAAAIDPVLAKFHGLPIFLVTIPPATEGKSRGKDRDLGDLSLEEARAAILAASPLRPGQHHPYFKGGNLVT